MSDGGSILGRAGPLMAARLASACFTVSIPLVLARLLDLAEYGTYKQLFLLSQTLFYVLPFGVAQSLYFFIPRTEAKRTFFAQTLIYLLVAGALAGLGLYALGPAVARAFDNPALLEHRVTLALYCACLVGAFPLELSLTSQGKIRHSARVYLISDAVRAAAMTVPVLLGWGLHGLMWAMTLFAVGRLLAAWIVMVRPGAGPLWSTRLFVSQLVYAVPFGAAILFSIPQQYAHQFAVSATVSPDLFALYAVGCFQLPLVDLLYTPASEVLMVRLGELEKAGAIDQAASAFQSVAGKLAYVFIPLAAFLFTAAPEFIAAVFGAKFLGAVPIFRIGVLGIPLAVLPMDGVLRARGETRWIFFSYALKAAVTAPLVWIGVTRFGMIGGISAWAAAEIVGKATLLARVPRALAGAMSLSVLDVLPIAELKRAFVAAIFAAAAVLALRAGAVSLLSDLPEGFAYRFLPLVIGAALFGAGYLAALRIAGVDPTGAMLLWLRRKSA